MLKYDTIHGQFTGSIEVKDGQLVVNGKTIRVTAEKNPADLKWGEIGAEYVVESTGLFLTKEKAQGHIDAGAKYVVMSAPSKDDTRMYVCGVNEKTYTKGEQFVSNASCTTNCLAPDVYKRQVGRLVERPAIGDQQKIVQRSWMHLAGREKILLVDQPEIILQELILVIHSPVERRCV